MEIMAMETACTKCTHRNVCKYKEEFLEAQEAVSNAVIGSDPVSKDGIVHQGFRYISGIDYIEPVKLHCKY